MFRFLNTDNFRFLSKCSRSWSTRPILCDLCLLNNHGKKGLHMSTSDKAQYLAALKHLLTKKTKLKKGKHRIEVLKATDTNLVNSTANVHVMRGKQLSALASRLSCSPSQNVIKRLYAVDTTRHYDPLLMLPVEIPNEFVETVLEDIDRKNRPKRLTKNLSFLGIRNTPSAVSVRDVIKNLENKRNQENLNIDLRKRLLRKKLQLTPIDKSKTVEALSFEDIDPVREIEEEEEEGVIKLTANKKKKKGPSVNVSLKKKIREEIAKHKMSDLEKKGKEDGLNMNFLSYCDVCVNTGMVNDAFFAVKSYRKKITFTKGWHPRMTNIEIYNTVIAGLAEEGNWLKISDLLGFIKEDGLKMNEQTFAGVLDCLARRRNVNQSHFKAQLNDMAEKGIDVHQVLSGTKLSPESRGRIIDAIQLVDKNFEAKPLAINLDYDCALLNQLNEQKSCLAAAVPATMSVEELQGFYKEQMAVETSNYVKIKTIEKRTDPLEAIQIYREKLAEAENNWRETVGEAFDRDMETIQGQSKHKTHFFFTLYPYLASIPKEEHVDIVLQEIRKLAEGSETYSPTTRQLFRDLGVQVFLRYQIKKKAKNGSLKQMDGIYEKYCEWYHSPDATAANTRQKWQKLLVNENAMIRLSSGEPMWKSHVLTAIGRFLYNIIIHDVKINVNVFRTSSQKTHNLPAFYTLFRTKGHSCKEEVKPHPVLSRLFRAAAPDYLIFESSKIPMACPPLPWTCITSGGYLITKTDLIRLPFQAVAQWKTLENTPVNQLYPAFDSLNQLGAVPWTVNEEMLDVILDVFNSGGSSKLDVPEPPSACPAAAPVTSEMSSTERAQIYRQRMAVRRQRAEMYSLWCDALYKLSLANHFRRRVFWLPHNMDFRGRVYPVAPHLNHLGSDLSRSLLVFAKGQPLGKNGLDWLKIHAINLTGTHKKKSVKDRLVHANEILEDIIDSANHPLTGKKWWMSSEEPWQTLAACMEIRNALASGNPADYLSQFPVHQDGSCNGLQHYAALGRDLAGGESVNLTPGSVPQDVYSRVAAIVERERAKDANNGVQIAQILENFIFRKVIKQTVMTTVYGVTRFGARLQIARQLKDLDDFPKEHVWQASLYLVTKTFDSLQEMFTSTKEIQDWFTECARLISQVCGENVQWVTPLGLPIVQPYSRNVSQAPDHIKFIGVKTSTITDAFERPNIMKQKNAFPPNFIHSLDSSHMMLTSILCERLGITFVSVHDCYWTHACTVPEMNRICRDQFVALHSYPILADLSKYFINRYSYPEVSFSNDGSVADLAKRNLNRILKDQPSTGSLDLQAVLKSPYFFS